MAELLKRLPKIPKRHYVPVDLDCSRIDELVKICHELLARPLPDVRAVMRWFQDASEFGTALEEHESLVYIRKSVDTRNKKAQAAFLHLIQRVHPALAPYKDKINKRLLEHPLRNKFPKNWERMLKFRQNAVSLFHEENVPIERQIEETAQEYSQLTGGLEVKFEGKKQTLIQMGVYQERPDRRLRRRAWETVAKRRFEEKDKIESIYERLIQLRHQTAVNAGFPNFRDFCHLKYDRFDYTPKECFQFHDSVEEVVMPAVRKMLQRRAKDMRIPRLKPWDLAVDPLGRPALHPFREGKQLATRTQKVFQRLDPQLGRQFKLMMRHGVLDLDNRSGKEPGGYQTTLPERKLPFIFMNAVGRDTDVRTLLHEGGHAFHMLASCDLPVTDYRHAPTEFCEVASMGMELLANREMQVFYPKKEELERSTRQLLEGTLEVLPWVATIDAFQQWVYTHPEQSREERHQEWMKIRARFSDGTDWEGLRHYEEVLWHRQLHLFGIPFYYIEYGIAQLGALMVWRRSLANRVSALKSYKGALKLGGSVDLHRLFKAAGGKFDFGVETMRPLVETVMEKLGY